MYSIFHPLDPNERLPRELILEGKRFRFFERRSIVMVAGFLFVPGLMLGVLILSSLGVQPPVALALAGVVFTGFFVWAAVSKDR